MYNPNDPQHRLIFESDVSFAVLGNESGVYRLVDLRLPLEEEQTQAALIEGFRYAGVVGIKDGVPGVRMEHDWASRYAVIGAAMEISGRLRAQRARQAGDFVKFAEGLMHLEDPR